LNSQIEIHKEYGGVYPNLARREHSKNLVPILEQTLEESGLLKNLNAPKQHSDILENVRMLLEREPELLEIFMEVIPKIKRPEIDYIAVTYGPGLEPALWVGINFAKALSVIWNIPLIPVNHMEGHVLSVLLKEPQKDADRTQKNAELDPHLDASRPSELQPTTYNLQPRITFPALALLISGGHTELVLMKDWLKYELIGETQDDAVGEAFDKVARMMGLPYPGGPQISALAESARMNADSTQTNADKKFNLPKPMINSSNCHFSFSGLKTAVLYRLKDLKLDNETKAQMAREFEDTVVEVLLKKTQKAIEENEVRTLIIGGGVIANREIRKAFQEFAKEKELNLLIPEMKLTTDNAIMIGIAGYFRALKNPKGVDIGDIRADGNLRLTYEAKSNNLL
jgi:N6-L-threonylcarbamoyladenine synthase